MTQGNSAVAHSARRAHAAAERAASGKWAERTARFGFATKGAVYIAIGLLAAYAAATATQPTGTQGALAAIVQQPFGQILLVITAVGLGAYALWRFVEAAIDPEGEGTDARAIALRIGYAGSGVIHAGLAVGAVSAVIWGGQQAGSEDSSAQGWTATLMAQPFGRWLVGAVGVGICIFALVELYRAWADKLDDRLALGRLSETAQTWIRGVCRFGMGARAVVFAVIGVLLILAAAQAQPGRARGLGGALRTLEDQPYGPWLLGIAGLGLAAYGLYMAVQARYRRFG